MIDIIKNNTIKSSLDGSAKTEYLAGDLHLPQTLKHIDCKEANIGINCTKEETIIRPHYHDVCTECETSPTNWSSETSNLMGLPAL